MNDCPFCLEFNTPYGDVLLKTEHAYIIANPDPVLSASHMIISRRHVETPFDLNDDEWMALKNLLRESKTLLDEQGAKGYNIGWNVGDVAGQHVMHAHLHVMGRFSDEPLAGKGIRYNLKQPNNTRSKA